jgi:sulfite reductase (NADPH) hemoprotein beta-component
MYTYESHDQLLVDQRAAQFGEQVERRFEGALSEDEFRPLRLQNGLYQEMHAYMLRINIPYGTLSSRQLRKLADVSRKYDKGYGHFTTRQNIQLNWLSLSDTPEVLAELATVEMHAIQSSGSCIRNVTADHFAGAAADEIEDPRIWAEIVRQWSTLHPEFAFLPRKFKIAVSGGGRDRAAIAVHDIGLKLVRNDEGQTGFEVQVGGGLGRTPMLGKTIREFLPTNDLLSYLEAVLRVYNQLGRRDNKYKARIKIMVRELGAEVVRDLVEDEWLATRDSALKLSGAEISRIRGHFQSPAFEKPLDIQLADDDHQVRDPQFVAWQTNNVRSHKQPGYRIVTVSLKTPDVAPGDASAEQMFVLANLADAYSFGEIRVSHEQNLILPHVRADQLQALWNSLHRVGLGTPNAGLATDIISCPGMDFCTLASARSIPVAQAIVERLHNLDRLQNIGELKIKISGCVNACAHHHVGHIGILGLEKKGQEFYQVTIGGRADDNAAIGQIVGPGFAAEEIPDVIEQLIAVYLEQRQADETFVETVERLGTTPFKESLYAHSQTR